MWTNSRDSAETYVGYLRWTVLCVCFSKFRTLSRNEKNVKMVEFLFTYSKLNLFGTEQCVMHFYSSEHLGGICLVTVFQISHSFISGKVPNFKRLYMRERCIYHTSFTEIKQEKYRDF